MKTCGKQNCKQINPQALEKFHKSSFTKDGLQYYCKECRSISDSSSLRIKYNKDRNSDPIHRLYHKEYGKNWTQKNLHKIAAKTAKYRNLKTLRTPKWLTKDQFKEIENFYLESHRLTLSTGVRYEVDHVIPLYGEFMSGLHVPWNLRITTKSFNCSRPKSIKPFYGNEPNE